MLVFFGPFSRFFHFFEQDKIQKIQKNIRKIPFFSFFAYALKHFFPINTVTHFDNNTKHFIFFKKCKKT